MSFSTAIENLRETVTPYVQGPYPWIALAVVVLVIILWCLLRRQPKRIVAFKGVGGNVFVSRRAVHDLVQKVCDGFPEVGKCRTLIRTRGRNLTIELKFQARAGSNLREITERLQSKVETVLRDTTGIERNLKINPVVSGFFGEVHSPKPLEPREKLDHAVYDEEVLLPEDDEDIAPDANDSTEKREEKHF